LVVSEPFRNDVDGSEDPDGTMSTVDGALTSADRSSETRYKRAYDDLRALLVSGEFEPNSRLTEAELTQRLNVSRGTLRSVLVRLAQEGYVTSEVNRGVRTRMFSVAEAADILEAREVLEAALAGKCAERASDEEIAGIASTLEAMRAAKRDGADDEYSQLNRRFHALVRAAAHQETLAQFVEELVYPLVMRQYRDLQAPHPRVGSLEEHQAILSAIITRNPEAAAAAMRHHISRVRRALELRYEPHSDGPRGPTAAVTETGEETEAGPGGARRAEQAPGAIRAT
jgi:DNA-binding GntR family transcriptional regulator